MKRDTDLIRLLLIEVEADSRHDGRNQFVMRPTFDGYSSADINYHFAMLLDGGYVTGRMRTNLAFSCGGLTMAGHDLLDALRDDEVWRKTKGAANSAGSWTIDLLKQIATAYAKNKLKQVTGLEV